MISTLPSNLAASLARLDLRLPHDESVPEIPRLLNSTVLDGGKRFRPALLFLMGELFGLEASRMAPFARVSELLHSATLAHDDVVDASLQRRHRDTLNALASNSRAVLAGDYLLARAIAELAEQGHLDITRDLSLALEDLVSGEWLQMDARGRLDIGEDHLDRVAARKTASLMRWCCLVPARLTSASPAVTQACADLGTEIGTAFQMADDLLDLERGGEKPYAQDLRDGLVNFCVHSMLELFPELGPPISRLLGDPEPERWPWTDAQVDQARDRLRVKMARRVERAAAALDRIIAELDEPSPEAVDSLSAILGMVAERTN